MFNMTLLYMNRNIPLQAKILFGYMMLMAVIISMAAILFHEHARLRKIEADTYEIRQARRDISEIHRNITVLASLGESVIAWEDEDYHAYQTRRLRVDSLLQMLLGFYAPPAPGLLPLVGMILLDYVLAFTLLGLAGAIAKPFKNRLVGVAVGTAAVCGIRFLCSFLSGIVTVIDQRNIARKTQQCPNLFFGHGCAGATNCIRNFSLYKCQYIELSFYPVHFIFPGDSSSGLVKAEYNRTFAKQFIIVRVAVLRYLGQSVIDASALKSDRISGEIKNREHYPVLKFIFRSVFPVFYQGIILK